MYERGYVEEEDVINIQEWILILKNIGYHFPDHQQPPYQTNIHNFNKHEGANLRTKIRNLGSSINAVIVRRNVGDEKRRDIVLSECTKHKVTFGSSDLHDGPRIQIPSVLLNMGQNYIQLGPDLCSLNEAYCKRNPQRNHPNVMSLPGMATMHNSQVSPVLQWYDDVSMQMQKKWPDLIANFYKGNSLIDKKMDAVICSFPASMCQIWMKLNKTIIFLPAHRYNLGRCSANEWRTLNIYLAKLHADPGKRRHIVGAVSRYDIEYIKYYNPNLNPTLISSHAGFYMNKYGENVNRNEILIFKKRGKLKGVDPAEQFLQKVKEVLAPELYAEWVYNLYDEQYTPDDLIRHPAVITLPYSVMSYRTSELYASAIPIFAPSLKFYQKYYDPSIKQFSLGWDRTSTKPYKVNMKCSLDSNAEKKMRQNQTSIHPYSPNIDYLEDAESEMYWLQFADFYDWPHVKYFDDYQHLKHIILNADFKTISNLMKQELILREKQVTFEWCKVINKVQKGKHEEND